MRTAGISGAEGSQSSFPGTDSRQGTGILVDLKVEYYIVSAEGFEKVE
jgi:hypothetical protein